MKKTLIMLLTLTGLFAFQTFANLSPETISLSYIRPQTSQYVNTNVYLAGSTVVFTNSKVSVSGSLSYTYSTNTLTWTTNDTRVAQDLTGLIVLLKIGNSKTNIDVTATNDVATNGTFWTTATLPTYEQLQLSDTQPGNLRIQCTLSNSTSGLTYTYRGDQYLYVRTPMKY